VLPALIAEFDLASKNLRAIDVKTDTFCSAGSWLGNASLTSGGGGQPGVSYLFLFINFILYIFIFF
jgi:hypothetical protein